VSPFFAYEVSPMDGGKNVKILGILGCDSIYSETL
jgi:hypothetical protein